MKPLKIDIDFKYLVPPLTDEEYSLLEETIVKDGCRDPIVAWEDIIVDGHNRYEICKTHNIDFNVVNKDFKSKTEAEIWIILNQFSRRNLTPFQRVELAIGLEEMYTKIGKEKMSKGSKKYVDKLKNNKIYELHEQGFLTGYNLEEGSQEDNNQKESAFVPYDRNKIISDIAGLSRATYTRGKRILNAATEELKERLRKGKTTIGKAYKDLKDKSKEEVITQNIDSVTSFLDSEKKAGIIEGDIKTSGKKINDEAIFCIITDPKKLPLDLWSEFGKLAKRVLKPGSFCIIYCDTLDLNEIMIRVSRYLTYYWDIILLLNEYTEEFSERKINKNCSHILVFQKPPITSQKEYIDDAFNFSIEESLIKLVESFTAECNLVLDPFVNGSTILEVAWVLWRKQGKSFIGLLLTFTNLY